MKFSDLKINAYFKLADSRNNLQKVSPFGYKDPENLVLGEVQIIGNPEVTTPEATA